MTPMKILVVEDNPISRKLTRLALETEGFGVIEAANGQSAIDSVMEQFLDKKTYRPGLGEYNRDAK